MKLLIFSDPHCHAFKPYSELLPNGRNSRLQDALNVLDQIYKLCRSENIDGVLCAGDMFHIRSLLSVSTFNEVYKSITAISNVVKFFVLLVGNHDQSSKDGKIHSVETFDAAVDVISVATTRVYNNLEITAIPYSDDPQIIASAIEEASLAPLPEARSGRILLGHFGVSGAAVGSNFVLTAPSLVTLNDLHADRFEQVFLGHYHQPQQLLDNVQYIGATHQHNWGDMGQERGVLIWEPGQPAVRYPLQAPKFIQMFPQHLSTPGLIEGNFVQVYVKELFAEEAWTELRGRLLSEGARWVEQRAAEVEQPTITTTQFNPTMDFEEMVELYVKDCDPQDNHQALTELGCEILRSVR